MAPPSNTHRRIHAVVGRIPKGKVATYGQVAALAGLPRQARLVGYALSALAPNSPVPWHRVVNAKGQVSVRSDGTGSEDLQRQLLIGEGVRFVGGVIPLDRFTWRPADEERPPRPAPARSGRQAKRRDGD